MQSTPKTPARTVGTRSRRRCVYCGMPVSKHNAAQPATCPAHADLPQRDPYYNELAGVA